MMGQHNQPSPVGTMDVRREHTVSSPRTDATSAVVHISNTSSKVRAELLRHICTTVMVTSVSFKFENRYSSILYKLSSHIWIYTSLALADIQIECKGPYYLASLDP